MPPDTSSAPPGHPARNAPCGDVILAEPLGQVLAVAYVHAEDDRLPSPNMIEIRVDDQLISRRDDHRLLDVAAIVLDLVEPHAAEVDVGLDANAADRDEFTRLDGLTQAEP